MTEEKAAEEKTFAQVFEEEEQRAKEERKKRTEERNQIETFCGPLIKDLAPQRKEQFLELVRRSGGTIDQRCNFAMDLVNWTGMVYSDGWELGWENAFLQCQEAVRNPLALVREVRALKRIRG